MREGTVWHGGTGATLILRPDRSAFMPSEGALLVADLKDVPFADAGLLRRWQEGHPGSRILWIGGEAESEAAFDDAGIRGARLPWPIDVESLEELAGGATPRAARSEAERSPAPAAAAAMPGSREAEHRQAPRSDGASLPEAHDNLDPDDRHDVELSEIESILGHGQTAEAAGAPAAADWTHGTTEPPPFEDGVAAEVMAGEGTPYQHAPAERPRSAFLRAPTSQAERPIPVPESTLRGPAPALQAQGLAGIAPEESAAPIESADADAHSLDGPLLTDEEIEAFFGESDDFVIPAMEPAGREAPVEDPEFRAKVALEALKGDASIEKLSRDFLVEPSFIKECRAKLVSAAPDIFR